MRRTQLVCDSPHSLQDETDYLSNIFSKNNYNTDFVRHIPYIRGTSETITCILQPYNIQYVVLDPRKPTVPLVRDFPENDKIFRREKKYVEYERYRDLLISILSAFLLWVKARN